MDNALLQRWKDGDSNAFDALYRKYFIYLYETAFKKIGSLEDAEEMVQDVFVAMYRNKANVEDNPLLYLSGILKHKVFDYRRKAKVYTVPLKAENESAATAGNNVMESIRRNELDTEIHHSIDQLPQQCRNVFLLSREENLSNREIADRLGISVKTVEGHISKALKYLREHLDYKLIWILLALHEAMAYMC